MPVCVSASVRACQCACVPGGGWGANLQNAAPVCSEAFTFRRARLCERPNWRLQCSLAVAVFFFAGCFGIIFTAADKVVCSTAVTKPHRTAWLRFRSGPTAWWPTHLATSRIAGDTIASAAPPRRHRTPMETQQITSLLVLEALPAAGIVGCAGSATYRSMRSGLALPVLPAGYGKGML